MLPPPPPYGGEYSPRGGVRPPSSSPPDFRRLDRPYVPLVIISFYHRPPLSCFLTSSIPARIQCRLTVPVCTRRWAHSSYSAPGPTFQISSFSPSPFTYSSLVWWQISRYNSVSSYYCHSGTTRNNNEKASIGFVFFMFLCFLTHPRYQKLSRDRDKRDGGYIHPPFM